MWLCTECFSVQIQPTVQYLLQVGEPTDEERVQAGAADRGCVQAAEVRRVGEVDRPPREVQSTIITLTHMEMDSKVSLKTSSLIQISLLIKLT